MFHGKIVSAAKWGRQGLVLAANDCTDFNEVGRRLNHVAI